MTNGGRQDGSRAELESLHRLDELALLYEAVLGRPGAEGLGGTLEEIVAGAAALCGTHDAWLCLAEPGADVLTLRSGTGVFCTQIGLTIAHGRCVAGRVWSSGEPLAVTDYRSWPGRLPELESLSLGSLVGVPVRIGGDIIGVLGLAHLDGGDFDAGTVALLGRVALLASLALERERLASTAQQELEARRKAEGDLEEALARLEHSRHDLRSTREELIRRLSLLSEHRIEGTGAHIERVSFYCAAIARRLGIDAERRELLRAASLLHDVGKIVVPDRVLRKAGLLTPEERREMEQHAEFGYRMLAGSDSPLLDLAATIAWTHHEHFDGSGYPRRLEGDAIPIEGRIVAVADVYDALTGSRPYRPGFRREDATRIMVDGRGSHFDPSVLDAFLQVLEANDLGEPAVSRPAGPGGRPAAADERPDRADPVVRECTGRLTLEELRSVAKEAGRLLGGPGEDRNAIDAALDRLHGLVPGLLVSVFVREHDRLWCVSQRGYEEVRDGFSIEQGVMARALRSGETQLVEDVSDDRDFIASVPDLRSEIAVPFGNGLGVLNVETRGIDFPSGATGVLEELARALARRVGRVGANLSSDLATLARLFVHASSLRGEEAIADFATRTLGRLLDLDSAQLSLGRNDGGYVLASFWCRPDSGIQPLSPRELQHVAGVVDPVNAACSILDLTSLHLGIDPNGAWPWLLWLPLEASGAQVGILVGRTARRLSLDAAHVEIATLFAPHVAALLDTAQTLRRERRAATTDPLTGLLNRRGFDQRFVEEIKRAERGRRELAVVILDCDGLKAINDRGGHELGDAVLTRVARCLRTQKRAGDVAGRLGGDEFALLLPEIDSDGAVRAAERLRRSIVTQVLEGGQLVTATFGVAVYPAGGATPNELLRAADQALYRAKKDGRNRTGVPGPRTRAA